MKYLPLYGIALLTSVLSPALTHTLAAQTAADPDPQIQIPRTPSPDALPDPADLVPWPVKAYPEFASDSVANAGSWLLDAPAGKHGHVRATPGGQLEFADGTPARFWGTTTVFALTFPEKPEEIAKLADSIAASGYNLVRFHHNDMNRNGMGFLQEKPKSNWKLDPQGMDRLDRFAAELYKRGIYMYVDIVDYRSILEEDGLEDWQELAKLDNMGWKGLFPHPKIVEAWKRSIAEVLQHKNPYTGRTWGEEPGVVTVEIINENGLYWDWNFKLSPGMLKWHDQQWNQWLVNRYKTRDKLDAAWTDIQGRKGLFPDEDPAKGTVFAPRHGNILEWDRPYRSKTRGAARLNDWYLHLAESSTAFYKEAAAHIRKQGFKGVILGSHELQGPGNQFAEVQGTGAIGAHLYATGMPAWNARPGTRGAVIEGVDVKANNWFTNIPRIKVRGAPGINGEWTGGALNRRADVNLAVAAITGFQGVTQSLHFSFGHRWIGEPMPNYDYSYKFQQHKGEIGFTFSSIHDVPWMAVNRVCAPLFMRGDFRKAKSKVHLAYSRVDVLEQNLHALGRSGGAGTIGDAGHFLPILHEVECVFFDEVYEGDAAVVFMTGRSASGDYRKARRAVLVGDNPFSDPYHKTRDLGLPAKTVNPGVKIVNLDTPTQFTVTWPWSAERGLEFAKLEGVIELASIPAGAQAIGKSADGKYTLGWVDDRYLVLPNGRAFGERIADNQWLYRLYLAACQRWKIDTADNTAGATFYQSDTRELTVDWAHGTTVVDTARTQGFSGLMGWRPENTARNLKAKIDTPYGNVLLTSTDGKALAESRRMLLVATGRSQNTGAELGKNKEGQLSFTNTGKAPILVEALRGEVTIKSSLAAKLKVFALDSTGRRLGPVETRVENGALSLTLSPRWGTIWFEVSDDSAPVETAKLASAGDWPRAETARTAAPPEPAMIALGEFFELVNRPKVRVGAPSEGGDAASGADSRIVAVDFSEGKAPLKYSNIAVTLTQDAERGQVLQAQFGKVDQSWAGGFWSSFEPAVGLKAEDCLGFGFTFKGDGTMPRECYLTLKAADGAAWRTANLNRLFESDEWREVLITPGEFELDPQWAKKNPDKAKSASAQPKWDALNRLDFVVIGPLMDQMSVAHFGGFYYAVKAGAEDSADASFRQGLPEPGTPATAKITIPLLADAEITADGKPAEAEWKHALAITMDEDRVPDWHFFGSHVVDGKHLNGESASFWLLGTRGGLALLAEVHKGTPGVVAEKKEWYGNDCVELFTDPTNQGGKPAKQIFVAYRRAGQNLPGASDASIQIGRAKLAEGYILEALIPWNALGFETQPTGEFGLEFQVDFAAKGQGRVLQMTYGTGTNEAWIKSERFLKAALKAVP